MNIINFPEKETWIVEVTRITALAALVEARTEVEAREAAVNGCSAATMFERSTVAKSESARNMNTAAIIKKVREEDSAKAFVSPAEELAAHPSSSSDRRAPKTAEEALRNFLLEYMRENELTTNSLAKRLNIPQKTLWTMTRGYTSPRLATVQKLADALGVTVVEMLA
jgi:predicted transcriptional regulator